jgi:uncharacterized SAM-binding protein YcdF (DUF218 family)
MRRYARPALYVLAAWTLLVAIPSLPGVRDLVAAPLCVDDRDARGDVAYVLAGGHAIWERLRAASDLYHMGRVPRILLMDVPRDDGTYFPAGRNWTATEWALGYLEWLGVPRDRVRVLPAAEGTLGTLAEARLVRDHAEGARRIVLVTSAPHTRRTLLAFRRTMPADVELTVYAATTFLDSEELFRPLFLEYVKLLVYAVVA